VRSSDTLFLVSKEGRGSLAPLTTALAAAVCEAAETLSTRSGGRLPVPLVLLLDEVANVCRWDQLPNLYSHYGGRGIILMAFLQNWSQGVNVWGQYGMQAMLDAANVFVYGGGVRDTSFLARLSQMVDKYRYMNVSTSRSTGGHTTNRSEASEEILSVGDLSSVPPGKAVVFASGMRPTLVNLVQWMDGPRAKEVYASEARHSPAAAAPPIPVLPPEPDVPTRDEVVARWTRR